MKLSARAATRQWVVAIAIVAVFVFEALGTAQAQAAADLYKAKCQACHGLDGTGNTLIGNRVGAHDFHSPEVQEMTDAQLIEVITEGKNKMPTYGGTLTADQIKGLAGYVSALAGLRVAQPEAPSVQLPQGTSPRGGVFGGMPETAQRVRVSQGSSEGNLISQTRPPYPPMAKMAGVQGAVVLQAIISKQGTIENLQVVSGHPMLVQAALDAVRQWRYRPYLLNGEPMEVETQITLNFSLTGASGQTAGPRQQEQEWGTTEHAQQEAQLRPLIERVCRGAWLPLDPDPQRPEAPAIKKLDAALGNIWQWSSKDWAPLFGNIGNRQVLVAVASNNEINAWEADVSPQHSLVCIPSGMIRFMGNEDEIAFIVAHEIGHALDDGCRTPPGVRHSAAEQVHCEIRADEIGYTLLRRAGYSPYAAAGAFGRLEMYSGDTHTGIVGWLRQMVSDHPITPKRIENMRELLLREIQVQPSVAR